MGNTTQNPLPLAEQNSLGSKEIQPGSPRGNGRHNAGGDPWRQGHRRRPANSGFLPGRREFCRPCQGNGGIHPGKETGRAQGARCCGETSATGGGPGWGLLCGGGKRRAERGALDTPWLGGKQLPKAVPGVAGGTGKGGICLFPALNLSQPSAGNERGGMKVVGSLGRSPSRARLPRSLR